jgi:hypothetical protein
MIWCWVPTPQYWMLPWRKGRKQGRDNGAWATFFIFYKNVIALRGFQPLKRGNYCKITYPEDCQDCLLKLEDDGGERCSKGRPCLAGFTHTKKNSFSPTSILFPSVQSWKSYIFVRYSSTGLRYSTLAELVHWWKSYIFVKSVNHFFKTPIVAGANRNRIACISVSYEMCVSHPLYPLSAIPNICDPLFVSTRLVKHVSSTKHNVSSK